LERLRLFVPLLRGGLRVDADDLRFDHDVIESADHHEMLDIVAPNQNELALTVQAESVDQPQP
jgi:hypothetical protein